MKSWLQQHRIHKKLEPTPKKKKEEVWRRLLYTNFVNSLYYYYMKVPVCIFPKESCSLKESYQNNSYIDLKILRGYFHVKLLRILVIKKVIFNLFLSFYLMYSKNFKRINKPSLIDHLWLKKINEYLFKIIGAQTLDPSIHHISDKKKNENYHDKSANCVFLFYSHQISVHNMGISFFVTSRFNISSVLLKLFVFEEYQ